MNKVVHMISILVTLAALFWGATATHGAIVEISQSQATQIIKPEGGALRAALHAAKAGDILWLEAGLYKGGITIDKSITLMGDTGAIIDADGTGSVIKVTAPDVTVKGLKLIGSGSDHEQADSGVFLDKTAHRTKIINNHISGNLIGVYLWGQNDAVVHDNVIIGRQDQRMNDRGNGVYVWNAEGASVSYNDIRYGRDGVFVNASKKNVFIGNRMRDLRFAIHYMYTHDSEISDNVSVNNHAGYALMFSDRLTVRSNLAIKSKLHGMLLNYTNKSSFSDNKIVDGGERCVFIYNSNRNVFTKNWFQECDIGIYFTGGSEGNDVTHNAFVNNFQQVKYVGTKWVEWSTDGRGNYWSDNPAFDVDQDGIADAAYKPNDLMDQIIWRHPMAKTLLQSPAVGILRWAQGQFPALYPGGVIDRHPMMQPLTPELSTYWSKQADKGAQ